MDKIFDRLLEICLQIVNNHTFLYSGSFFGTQGNSPAVYRSPYYSLNLKLPNEKKSTLCWHASDSQPVSASSSE